MSRTNLFDSFLYSRYIFPCLKTRFWRDPVFNIEKTTPYRCVSTATKLHDCVSGEGGGTHKANPDRLLHCSLSLHAARSDTAEAPIHTADVAPGKSSGYKQVLSDAHLQKTSLSGDTQLQCICLRSAQPFAWVSSNRQSVSASPKPDYKRYRHKGEVHSVQECIRRSAQTMTLLRWEEGQEALANGQ